MRFSDFGCYGLGDQDADHRQTSRRRLRYSASTTTAMCSTTRSGAADGRNHHSSASAVSPISIAATPDIAARSRARAGRWPKCCGATAIALHGRQMARHAADRKRRRGPFDGWPLGRGFDRFYGFLDAEKPISCAGVVSDNTHFDSAGIYADGYHSRPT